MEKIISFTFGLLLMMWGLVGRGLRGAGDGVDGVLGVVGADEVLGVVGAFVAVGVDVVGGVLATLTLLVIGVALIYKPAFFFSQLV